MDLLNLPDDLGCLPFTHGFQDDFYSESADQYLGFWTETDTDGGSVALDADGVGGVMALTTGTTDNNEVYLESPERFLFAADKPFIFQARVQFTEAATDDANILVGLMDAPGADSLVDNGAGPKASYSGAVFYKVDGGTRWQVESSLGATQITHDTDVTAGGSSYQTLRIVGRPISSTEIEIEFWIDPSGGNAFALCRENGANPRTPSIKHTLTYTSATEMAVVLGAKAGGANAETLNVDYVACYQKR